MTSVVFETATIADAVRRAARIAPGKAGIAFDKAAGILMEIIPGDDAQCIMRATNLDAFQTEVIAVVQAEGDSVRWRLPSQLLNMVVGNLPPKAGSQVKFTHEGNKVVIQQGRMKSTMQLIDDSNFPDWEMFDSSEFTQVTALGQKISMVEWAASSDGTPPLCAVYLDGENVYSTDRYKVARFPCKIDLEKPVMIPSGILGTSLKAMGDTGVGRTEHKLLLAVDDWTQISTVLYQESYPPVKMFFDTVYEAAVEVNKADLLEKLNRANSYSGAERSPTVRTFWGQGEIAVMMENAEVGLFGDVVEVGSGLGHRRVPINFTPKNLIDALNHAPGNRVTLHYDYTESDPRIKKTIKVVGDGGYECVVMKRAESKPTA